MLYNSWQYALFLVVVLSVYFILNLRWQNIWLLLASYYFFGYWDWRFLSLFFLSTLAGFYCALQIEAAVSPQKKKFYLVLCLAVNLLILGFFKYFNFFTEAGIAVFNLFGGSLPHYAANIILPIGISFYTFQTMAYVIDVYRGRVPACRDLIDFCLFINFFSTAVCGPIDRADNLMAEIQTPRKVTIEKFESGLFLIFVGLFKKIAIADPIGRIVAPFFSDPDAYQSAELLLGCYLFSLQIYCDFCGYSDIARGTGKLFGFDIMENFKQPYFASNISDFWRRWHISLSTWLRDYLYKPLGGNRKGLKNTVRNLMIVMLLGGLWHGASWTFIIWGGLHGFYLVVYRLYQDVRLRLAPVQESPERPWLKYVKIIFVFHLVSLTWIFFRSPDFYTAYAYFLRLFQGYPNLNIPVNQTLQLIALTSAKALFFALPILLVDYSQIHSETSMLRWRTPLRYAAYAYMMLMMIFLSPEASAPFVYFQF